MKNLLMLIILLSLKKLKQIVKLTTKLELLFKYKNIFSKGYTENWPREIFIINSVLKTNPWTYKIKDLNRKKNNDKFFIKKNCF